MHIIWICGIYLSIFGHIWQGQWLFCVILSGQDVNQTSPHSTLMHAICPGILFFSPKDINFESWKSSHNRINFNQCRLGSLIKDLVQVLVVYHRQPKCHFLWSSPIQRFTWADWFGGHYLEAGSQKYRPLLPHCLSLSYIGRCLPGVGWHTNIELPYWTVSQKG